MRRVAIAFLLCSGCGNNYWSHSSSTAGAIAGAAVAGAALAAAAVGAATTWKENDAASRSGYIDEALVPYEAVLTECPGRRSYSRVCDHGSGCRYETSGGWQLRCSDRDCTKGPPPELLEWCNAVR